MKAFALVVFAEFLVSFCAVDTNLKKKIEKVV